jgi:hypothetical protein
MPFLVRFAAVLAMLASLTACGGGDDDLTARSGVNRFIWQASLDTLSFLPLESADPFSGLIVTGWGNVEGSPGLYRVTVYIQSADLGVTSIRVAAFRQAGGGSAPLSAESIAQIEDAILLRARQLRTGSTGA